MRKFDNYVSNLRVLERADKELLAYEGIAVSVTGSPRSIIKEAYAVYPFFDGELWLKMLRERNDMAHIYDGNAAKELVGRILQSYIPEFQKIEKEFATYYGDSLKTI